MKIEQANLVNHKWKSGGKILSKSQKEFNMKEATEGRYKIVLFERFSEG